MEQTEKFHKLLLRTSLPPPSKPNIGFERLFFQNLPDFRTEIGEWVEVVKIVTVAILVSRF